MDTKNCMIVLGMHRSGTSGITNYLCDLGFSLASESLPPHPQDYPRGYWKSREVVMLNHRFLKEIGSDWKDVNPLPSNFLSSSIARDYRLEIDELLKRAFFSNKSIVLKDPLLCRLLPLWMPVLQDHCSRTALLYIVRNAESVYRSLAKSVLSEDIKAGAIQDKKHAFALWLRYNLEAEHNSQSIPRIVVSFESWLKNTDVQARRIENFLGSCFAELELNNIEPDVIVPRHFVNDVARPWSDAERIVNYVYDVLVGLGPRERLGEILKNFDITIPASNQKELRPPPTEIVSAALIKHACAITPLDPLRPSGATAAESPKTPVVYVSDMVTNRSHIYRVKNAVDALNSQLIPAWWTTSSRLAKNLSELRDARVVIIHRSQWNSDIESIFNYCKAHNISTISDIDDLIYDPDFVDLGYIHFIKELAPEGIEQWKGKIRAFRRTLLSADKCIVSTPSIQDDLNRRGEIAFCVENGFSVENALLSDHWRAQPWEGDEFSRLGYASGSLTHSADFSLVAQPIAEFLFRHPNWKLTVIGDIDIRPYKDIFSEAQIEMRPLVAHINLAYELRRLNINLIPLERNPFCDSKSPLKWYEAALCGVPSIAISSPMYEKLFNEGYSGLVASTKDEWLDHISCLANSTELRKELADNARVQALRCFNPSVMVDQLKSVL